ncbi:hypothetical protein LZ023_40790 (plasmid) [Pseudomonas silvicola]|nr:hypothetical protein LZ023_41065 [Pseudomonas silvicola]WAH62273.1 hypothetical protein LZ023_40790 [Pseudomonas silvicola]
MKKWVRSAIAAAVIGVIGSQSLMVPVVEASGFPTVDIAAIAQSVAEYSTQLQQYVEQMQQTVLEESQLAQLVSTYEQALTSYNHMLRQMTQLKNMMDRRDWTALMGKYSSVIDSFPGSGGVDFGTGKWVAKGKELATLYKRIENANSLEQAIKAIPFNSKSSSTASTSADQAYAREQLAVGQSLFVDDMNNELETQMTRYGEVAEKRASLGAEDHLATLQVMAEQNELTIEALQQQNAISNAQLQYSNQLPSHVFALQNQGRMATLSETKAKLEEDTTVDETQLSGY